MQNVASTSKAVRFVNNSSARGGKVIALTEDQETLTEDQEIEQLNKRIHYLITKKNMTEDIQRKERDKQRIDEDIQILLAEIADKNAMKNNIEAELTDMEAQLAEFLKVEEEEPIVEEEEPICLVTMTDECLSSIAKKKEENDEKKAGGSRERKKRTTIDRKAYLNYFKDRMVFKASATHTTKEVVFNAQTKKFYDRRTNEEYKDLQDANRALYRATGCDKTGNAWANFKALNLKTNKTRSIMHLHNEDWITEEGAEEYVDRCHNF